MGGGRILEPDGVGGAGGAVGIECGALLPEDGGRLAGSQRQHGPAHGPILRLPTNAIARNASANSDSTGEMV